ncbi:MAG: hypothetical protein GAK28_03191 [Luteibacter sp.]|uniref:hypothetical protein n=1 Tax=Luteibacter sp. TaxID=1886636 RepID=UPI0013823BC6|nr:hypothetical protein [Luteibacter sp.]KAF1005439.1 MAG: hypothetical protein GAK28_03191 [Luteibacter sp.]
MNAFIAIGDRIEQRIRQAIAWWCTAPCDERKALVFLLIPLVAVAVIAIAFPAPAPRSLPGR